MRRMTILAEIGTRLAFDVPNDFDIVHFERHSEADTTVWLHILESLRLELLSQVSSLSAVEMQEVTHDPAWDTVVAQ